jgi:hypothetical protein
MDHSWYCGFKLSPDPFLITTVVTVLVSQQGKENSAEVT